jgi:hypothetical protein
MDTKNLNKKVGCALIAASLFAVSSVQGSDTYQGANEMTEADTFRIQYVVARGNFGECLKFFRFDDCCIRIKSVLVKGEKKTLIALMENSQSSLDYFRELYRHGFLGWQQDFVTHPYGNLIICTPLGYRSVVL